MPRITCERVPGSPPPYFHHRCTGGRGLGTQLLKYRHALSKTLAIVLRVDTMGLAVIQKLGVDTMGMAVIWRLGVDTTGLVVIWRLREDTTGLAVIWTLGVDTM